MSTFVSFFRDAHVELLKTIHWHDFLLAFTQSEKSLSFWKDLLKEMEFFYRSVNWSEPFVTCLIAFHCAILAVLVYTTILRPCSVERLCAVNIFLIVLAFAAIPLNRIGQNYGEIIFRASGVNYFDESGIFLALLYWVPLVIQIVWIELCIIIRSIMEIARLKQPHISLQPKIVTGSNELKNNGINES